MELIPSTQIALEKYKIIRRIGEGGFGEVFLILNNSTNKNYVAKFCFREYTETEDKLAFANEIQLLSNINYPLILKYYGYTFHNNRGVIIADYIKNSSLELLFNNISVGGAPKEWNDTNSSRYIILLGIALGMKQLHSINIVHRDLKPGNILLDENFYPRISDFGLSKITQQNLNELLMTTNVGTPFYMAQEIDNGKTYNYKVDIYSFSLIAFELITGQKEPFDIKLIKDEKIQEFILKCHSDNPEERPDFTEICEIIKSEDFISSFCGKDDRCEIVQFNSWLEGEIEAQTDEKNEKVIEIDDKEIKKKTEIICNAFVTDENHICYKLTSKDQQMTAEIIKSEITKDELEIPQTIKFSSDEYMVVSIAENAFSNSSIHTLKFAENSYVKSIGNFAFKNSELECLFIPESLTNLDPNWCYGADKLNRIFVDEKNKFFNVKDNILYYIDNDNDIKDLVFVPRNFSGDFSVSDDIKRVCNAAMSGINGLQNVIFQNKENVELSDYCFLNSTNLKSCDFQSDYVFISRNCFENCTSLENASFMEGKIVHLQDHIFKGCKNFLSFSLLKKSKIRIEKECFCEAEALTTIGIDTDSFYFHRDFLKNCASLKFLYICVKHDLNIHSGIFEGCNSLHHVQLKTTHRLLLLKHCFNDLKELKEVNLEGDYIDIDDECFTNCSCLTNLNCKSKGNTIIRSCQFNGCENLFEMKFEYNGMLEINETSFIGANSLKQITFNGKNVCICNNNLNNLHSLEKLNINAEKVTIEINQENVCQQLQSIVIESINEITITDNTFSNCPEITTVALTGPKITIGKNSFENCQSLKTLNIRGQNAKQLSSQVLCDCVEIKSFAFFGNNDLEDVTIYGNNVISEMKSFANCSSLRSFKINQESIDDTSGVDRSSSVKLGMSCFENDVKLETVFVKSADVVVKESCFQNCSSLNLLHITGAIDMYLGSNMFINCERLENVDFCVSNSLTIANFCFRRSKVKSIEFQGDKISIGEKCFLDSNCIQTFFISSARVTNIFASAFQNNLSPMDVFINSTCEIFIRKRCFQGAQNLKTVECQTCNMKAEQFSFSNCCSMTSFKLSNTENITFLHNSFENCNNISEISWDAVNSLILEYECFCQASNLKSFRCGCRNSNLGVNCFKGCHRKIRKIIGNSDNFA